MISGYRRRWKKEWHNEYFENQQFNPNHAWKNRRVQYHDTMQFLFSILPESPGWQDDSRGS